MRLYVHGAGRSGREAWPAQSGTDAVFVDHSSSPRMADKARLVGAQCPDGPVAVVAHSLGAVPAALALAGGAVAASHVVLLEPALHDVARGEAAVERHIAPMTRAREHAARGDLFGYWQIVGPLMFGRAGGHDAWPDDEDLARRFAELEPPWGHGIEAGTFGDVPTLVVTGGWNDEYEVIAERLVRAGATHVTLAGAGHRPQDHPGLEPVLADFLG